MSAKQENAKCIHVKNLLIKKKIKIRKIRYIS